MVEIYLALEVKNYAWVRKNLDQLASIDAQKVIFDLQRQYYKDEETYNKVVDNFKKVLNKVSEELKNPNELKLAVNNLNISLDKSLFEELITKFEASWSLTDIRERINRGIKTRHIGLWYKLLSNRGGENEINKFLSDNMSERSIKKLPLQSYRLFTKYYPPDDVRRKIVLSRVDELIKQKSFFDQYILIKVLGNDAIKRNIKNRKFKKASFKLERDFYRNAITNGQAIQFSLYNLLRLGDLDESLLWWLSL